MTFQNRLDQYLRGEIATRGFATDGLSFLDEANADAVQGALPPEVIDQVLRFVKEFRPEGPWITFGDALQPNAVQVEIARRWLASKGIT